MRPEAHRCAQCRLILRRDELMRGLCRMCTIAQEVTDEVMGQGAYANINRLAEPLVIQEEPDGLDM